MKKIKSFSLIYIPDLIMFITIKSQMMIANYCITIYITRLINMLNAM
jgi:hypothetical protein